MLNSYWEEQDMSIDILNFHEEVMDSMELPQWMKELKCPFCKEPLPLRSIRSVTLKFNTRNLGDVAVEVFCDKCKKMDSIYYVKQAENVPDFVNLLNSNKNPSVEPILEEVMYKKQYNNVVEKMAQKYNKEKENGAH